MSPHTNTPKRHSKAEHNGLVAIIGRPNAGKSTLLNRLLGTELAIVSPKPQTTRDRLHGIFEDERGQIVFVDTPGLHRAKEGGLNAYMVGEAATTLEGPDAVWYLIDPNSAPGHERVVIEILERALAGTPTPVFLVLNKVDQGRQDFVTGPVTEALTAAGVNLRGLFRISARKGSGIPDLLTETYKVLPEGAKLYPDSDALTDRSLRYLAAEKVREQLFSALGDELPYACAIRLDRYQEAPEIHRIEATIFVERDSQKGMVVGQGGRKIKEIGQGARQTLERFLKMKVYLGLQVKVLSHWSRDKKALKDLGYLLPESRS